MIEIYIIDRSDGLDIDHYYSVKDSVILDLLYVISYCRFKCKGDIDLVTEDEMLYTLIDHQYFEDVSIRMALEFKEKTSKQIDELESLHDLSGLIVTDAGGEDLMFASERIFRNYHPDICSAWNTFYMAASRGEAHGYGLPF